MAAWSDGQTQIKEGKRSRKILLTVKKHISDSCNFFFFLTPDSSKPAGLNGKCLVTHVLHINPNGQQLTLKFPLMFSLLIQDPSLILYSVCRIRLNKKPASSRQIKHPPPVSPIHERVNRIESGLQGQTEFPRKRRVSHSLRHEGRQ